MDTNERPVDRADAIDRADADDVDTIRRQLSALTRASTERHRLVLGTPEYAEALDTELRLADRVWQLGAALRPPSPNQPEQGTRAAMKRRKG